MPRMIQNPAYDQLNYTKLTNESKIAYHSGYILPKWLVVAPPPALDFGQHAP